MPLRSDAVAGFCIRRLVVLLAPVVLVVSLGAGAPAAAQPAQSSDEGEVVDTSTEIFDENESEATIRWVTRALVGIAAGTGFLLVIYIWHTNPRRRLRVATRRRERRESNRRQGLEDEFLLPHEMPEDAEQAVESPPSEADDAEATLPDEGLVTED